MFGLSPLANFFFALGFAGLGICVVHILLGRIALMRAGRLNPFSLRDAGQALGGAYDRAGTKPLFARGYGRLALALMVIGLFGVLGTVIVETVMTPRA